MTNFTPVASQTSQIFETSKVSPDTFKPTELGDIPAEWDVMRLGDLLQINLRNGIYKPRKLYGKGQIRIIQLNDIYSDDHHIHTNSLD